MKRRAGRLAPVVLLPAAMSCASAPPPESRATTASSPAPRPPTTASPRPPHSVVVVAIDGVRWQEVFRGVDPALGAAQGVPPEAMDSAQKLMPNLHGLLASDGAAIGAPDNGAPVVAAGPNFVSLPGYREMLSGRWPSGCVDNACPRVTAATLADEFARIDPRREDVAVVASWPTLANAASADPQRLAISAGRHGGATRDALGFDARARSILDEAEAAAPHPGHGDFRPDRFTAELALRYLRHHRPKFLFVGLGETDEYGHRNDYKRYLEALRFADGFVGDVARDLRTLRRSGTRTLLVVTTDHGRAEDFVHHGEDAPESARAWIVAAGSGIQARGFVSAPTTRRLADIAPTIRRWAGLPDDGHSSAGNVLTELALH